MRLLAVTHWSFGRDRSLLRKFHQSFEYFEVRLQRIQTDIDLNRTVVTFTGDSSEVVTSVMMLADRAFDTIDLNRHVGAYPRIGALDECAFVVPYVNSDPEDHEVAQDMATFLGEILGQSHQIPVYMHPGTESRRERELLSLREGGFGSMQERLLDPDFGPTRAHPHCGVAVVGAREPYVAFWAKVPTADFGFASSMVEEMAALRADGDERFIGLEASAHKLGSTAKTLISVEMTMPDLANADPVVEWMSQKCRKAGLSLKPPEPVGGILAKHRDGTQRLKMDFRHLIVAFKPKHEYEEMEDDD